METREAKSPEEFNLSCSSYAITKSLIQSIENLITTSSLDEILNFLLEYSRSAQGRSDLASKNTIIYILRLLQTLSMPSTDSIFLQVLRVLRNLCAGEVQNQTSFIKEQGIETLFIIGNSLDFESPISLQICRICLQTLGNVALGGEEHRSAIWEKIFDFRLHDLLRMRRSDVCDPLCMVLYVCCGENQTRFEALCQGEKLSTLIEIIKTGSSVGFRENWMPQLFSSICFEGSNFPVLFSKLACHQQREDETFSLEQVFLLSLLSETLNHQTEEFDISNTFVLCVFETLRKIVVGVNIVTKTNSSLPTGIPDIDILGYSLAILRDICAFDNGRHRFSGTCPSMSNSQLIIESLLSEGLLELLLSVLHQLGHPKIIKNALKLSAKSVNINGSMNSRKVCPYKGFRRDVVSVIANCTFRKKQVQDKIREQNGILLLMQQCVADEENPFLREWGIWAVRNLLEGNEENQREVAEMEIQGVVDTEETAELGIQVEIDEKTRRPKLVNSSDLKTS